MARDEKPRVADPGGTWYTPMTTGLIIPWYTPMLTGQTTRWYTPWHDETYSRAPLRQETPSAAERRKSFADEGTLTTIGRAAPMKASRSISEFVEDLRRGPAYVRVPIEQTATAQQSVSQAFLSGVSGGRVKEAISQLNANLRGICPECHAWTSGDILGMVGITRALKPSSVTFAQYGDTAHLLDGRCINSRCACKDILLIWEGWKTIEETVLDHLGRVRRDAEKTRDATKLRLVEALANAEVMAFTKDACFSFHLSCEGDSGVDHAYVGRGFSSVPNLIVWVSYVPGGSPGVNRAFPQGYAGFLDQIMDQSSYSRGDRCIAHWIRHQKGGEWALSLALLPEWGLDRDKKFVILPQDLLSEAELRKCGFGATGPGQSAPTSDERSLMFRRYKCTNPQCVMNKEGRILMTNKPVYERISCEECGASMTQVEGDDRIVFVGDYPDTVLPSGALPIAGQPGGILSGLFGGHGKVGIQDPDIGRYPSVEEARDNPAVLHPNLFGFLQTADLFLVRQGDCGATIIVARCASHHLRVPLSASPPVGIHVEAHCIKGYNVFGVYTLVWDNSKVPWYAKHTIVPYDYVGANEEEMSRPLFHYSWRKLFYLLTQEATQIIFVDERHRVVSVRNATPDDRQKRRFGDLLKRLAACSGRQIRKPDPFALHPEYNRAVKIEEVQTRFPRMPRS